MQKKHIHTVDRFRCAEIVADKLELLSAADVGSFAAIAALMQDQGTIHQAVGLYTALGYGREDVGRLLTGECQLGVRIHRSVTGLLQANTVLIPINVPQDDVLAMNRLVPGKSVIL